MVPIRRKGRRGLARVELVVLVLIFLVVGGMVAAGVGRIRHTAQRAAAAHTLQGIGLALINRESAIQKFPLGYDADRQQSFYCSIVLGAESPEILPTLTRHPRPFALLTARRSPETCAPGTAPCDYGFAASTPETKTILGGAGEANRTRVSSRDIKDGASHTLLASVISVRPEHYAGRNGVDSPWPSTSYGRELRRFVRDTDPEAGDTRLGSPFADHTPGVFADGHVGYLSYDIGDEEMRSLWSFDEGKPRQPLP